jgi:hypothetical protein
MVPENGGDMTPHEAEKLGSAVDRPRIFVSYASDGESFATDLAQALEIENLAVYLAARAMRPGTDWQVTLKGELASCLACVAILTPAFQRSKWCDQEVGFVLGRGRAVVPVRPTSDDPPPYGLISSIQAITADTRPPREIASMVFSALLANGEAQRQLLDIAFASIESERDTAAVRAWLSRLAKLDHLLDDGHRARLAKIVTGNSAIRYDEAAYELAEGLLR